MEKIFTYAENASTNIEIDRRNKRLCLYSELSNGEWKFCCNNKVSDKITICLCKNHIKYLNRKYKINIDSKINKKIQKWIKEKLISENDLINSPFIQSINKNIIINNKIDPETRWINDVYFLLGLPPKWLNELVYFDSLIKGVRKQGEYNGPDFIFQNINNRKLIGFEIVSYKWNMHEQFIKPNTAINFYKNNLYNSNSFDNWINDMQNLLLDKNKKSNSYKKTDYLYLAITVNDTIHDYHYYILEVVLNRFVSKKKLVFDGIIIL